MHFGGCESELLNQFGASLIKIIDNLGSMLSFTCPHTQQRISPHKITESILV